MAQHPSRFPILRASWSPLVADRCQLLGDPHAQVDRPCLESQTAKQRHAGDEKAKRFFGTLSLLTPAPTERISLHRTRTIVSFCVPAANARVAKLVDAPDLGSGGAIHAGSSPVSGTEGIRRNSNFAETSDASSVMPQYPYNPDIGDQTNDGIQAAAHCSNECAPVQQCGRFQQTI